MNSLLQIILKHRLYFIIISFLIILYSIFITYILNTVFFITGLTLFYFCISAKNFESLNIAFVLSLLSSTLPLVIFGYLLPYLGINLSIEMKTAFSTYIAFILLKGIMFNPKNKNN